MKKIRAEKFKAILQSLGGRRLVIIGAVTVGVGLVSFGLFADNSRTAQKNDQQPIKKKTILQKQDTTSTEAAIHSTNQTPGAGINASQSQKVAAAPKATTSSTGIHVVPRNLAKPGDVVSYNAVKNEKSIFAGPLLFSPSTITISRSNPNPTMFTVSTFDGKAISMPFKPYDNDQPYHVSYYYTYVNGVPTQDPNGYKQKAATWNLRLDVSGAPVGTYSGYLLSYDGGQDPDEREYYGWFTINVID